MFSVLIYSASEFAVFNTMSSSNGILFKFDAIVHLVSTAPAYVVGGGGRASETVKN